MNAAAPSLPPAPRGTHITPHQFSTAFLQAVTPLATTLLELWNARRAYSELMFESILPQIGTRLGIAVYNADYYYLDSVFYTDLDTEHFPPSTYYAKNVSIAIEHEHDVRGSAVEMNRLQLINTPLKVLITYAQHAEERELHLERYAKIVRDADLFGDFGTHRRQLVIFGSTKDETQIQWDFYLYGESKFQELAIAGSGL